MLVNCPDDPNNQILPTEEPFEPIEGVLYRQMGRTLSRLS
jgi:hypothetical protein